MDSRRTSMYCRSGTHLFQTHISKSGCDHDCAVRRGTKPVIFSPGSADTAVVSENLRVRCCENHQADSGSTLCAKTNGL